MSLPAKTTTIFGYIPAPYRPAISLSAAGTPKANTGYEIQLDVDTDGKVSVYNTNPNSASDWFGATLTYPY